MRRIIETNSLWPIAASIAQGQSSAKLCLAHELHELLFGHLGLFVSHIALVLKSCVRNAQQVGIGNLTKAQLLECRRQTHALAKLEHLIKLGRALQTKLHHQAKCHGLTMHGLALGQNRQAVGDSMRQRQATALKADARE